MKDAPSVCAGDIFRFGIGHPRKKAVVCNVYTETEPLEIEVVYLDTKNRAINEDMFWNGEEWKFKIDGPNGGYADNYERLAVFVSQLRAK
ncbi:hypothetical protein L5M43_06320 [Shewanella sp. SW36]|jgi:hypothetical protein|uniref:hypothetical protein n=1 Tax=unclassified Shewanella TaxID=196818 RepID=UPI0021D9A0A6|nr:MULTISPECIES: hypothetical protein [unclassified Shewanella]MCU7974894.1 hypothetical protein [Shewanella sp. SW36]MCU7990283.1 hypothetical protein [Shewanella sp. SW1]MCU8052741.1 hypothetical protein [Shewanella sp. SM43]